MIKMKSTDLKRVRKKDKFPENKIISSYLRSKFEDLRRILITVIKKLSL